MPANYTSKRNPAYVGVVDGDGNLIGTQGSPLVVTSSPQPQGNALPEHVLEPHTFLNADGLQTGSMVDHTGMSPVKADYQPGIPTEVRIVVPEGFYKADNPSFPLFVYEPNLSAANIPVNLSMFGVSGSYTSDADATAADIKAGKTAYVNGVKITGTAP
ncbi:hypothetical protein [Mycobacterium tuberculosis]|uniref:hypothetical protein n=1 Tax=Mycobacterium tuberculosis TaxID=1773 RepID=UPI0012DC764F|nr:hypothetical protein [Mycobacterium tuberculosis]